MKGFSKAPLFFVSLLTIMGHSSSALAATIYNTRIGALNSPATATDVYQLNCPSSPYTSQGAVQILDYAPVAAPVVRVQISKGGITKTTSDPIDGDTIPSAPTAVFKGPGIYTITVSKSASGTEIYTLYYACINASTGYNVHGILTQTQDQ